MPGRSCQIPVAKTLLNEITATPRSAPKYRKDVSKAGFVNWNDQFDRQHHRMWCMYIHVLSPVGGSKLVRPVVSLSIESKIYHGQTPFRVRDFEYHSVFLEWFRMAYSKTQVRKEVIPTTLLWISSNLNDMYDLSVNVVLSFFAAAWSYWRMLG